MSLCVPLFKVSTINQSSSLLLFTYHDKLIFNVGTMLLFHLVKSLVEKSAFESHIMQDPAECP